MLNDVIVSSRKKSEDRTYPNTGLPVFKPLNMPPDQILSKTAVIAKKTASAIIPLSKKTVFLFNPLGGLPAVIK